MVRHPDFSESLRALKKDPKMARVVRKHGTLDLSKYHKDAGSVFARLVRSIIYQQISGKAAAAILERVAALFPKNKPTPELLLKLPVSKLRKAGLSPQKISYVRDLAEKYIDGTIDEKRFPKMSSQEIIDHLVQVKGIGVWTAHMLLIFTLYRPDILPWGDLAIQKGFKEVYALKKLPDKKRMERIARPWRAHATAASWYLWRVADDAKIIKDRPL
ncbi:MAG: 3-methyladenine DNA glycosylase/8-oxoguanine DNA glycosylase [Parcubacteria group bacterium Athens0416_74]|nr:MAG: 3-methyladenine DNA glycosylase/8-oxoguanine DNA glycosylase [Parcubacteria group bacterium Athens0416_74]